MAIVNEGTVKYEVVDIAFTRALPGVAVQPSPMVAPYVPQARVTVTWAVMVPSASGDYECVATKTKTWAGAEADWLLAGSASEIAAVIAKAEAAMVADSVVAGVVEVQQ